MLPEAAVTCIVEFEKWDVLARLITIDAKKRHEQ